MSLCHLRIKSGHFLVDLKFKSGHLILGSRVIHGGVESGEILAQPLWSWAARRAKSRNSRSPLWITHTAAAEFARDII